MPDRGKCLEAKAKRRQNRKLKKLKAAEKLEMKRLRAKISVIRNQAATFNRLTVRVSNTPLDGRKPSAVFNQIGFNRDLWQRHGE